MIIPFSVGLLLWSFAPAMDARGYDAGFENLVPQMVITGNTLPLHCRVNDPDSTIRAVEFYVKYLDDKGDNFAVKEHPDKSVGVYPKPETHYNDLIGVDSAAPYLVTWDLAAVPDQDGRTLVLWTTLILKNGRRTDGARIDNIIIDRHPEIPEFRHTAPMFKGTITVDGRFDDWPQAPVLSCHNGQDSLSARMVWNRDGLYMAIEVTDAFLYMQLDTLESGAVTLAPGTSAYWNDAVILLFDPAHDRTNHMNRDDFPVVMTPLGTWYNHGYLTHNQEWTGRFDTLIRVKSVLHGTLNNLADRDSGYTIEAFFPKGLFGGTEMPETLGFDIALISRNNSSLFQYERSWSGLYKRNISNPTEWGAVILKRPEGGIRIGILAAGCVVALMGFIVFLKRRKDSASKQKAAEQTQIESSGRPLLFKQYIRSHLQDEGLTVKSMAAHFNMHPNYFGSVFKEETGLPFSEYLNNERIIKARELLKNTMLTASQISFEIGYGGVSYFNKIFKKIEGITPLEYRNKFQVGQKSH